jgi:hypothetical protein
MRTGHAPGNATDTPAFGRLNFIADAANERSSNCIHQAIMFDSARSPKDHQFDNDNSSREPFSD